MSLGSYAWGTRALAGPATPVVALASTASVSLNGSATLTAQKPLGSTASVSLSGTAKIVVGVNIRSTASAALNGSATLTVPE